MDASKEQKRGVKAVARAAAGDPPSLLDLMGQCEWDRTFDYKAGRSRDRIDPSALENDLGDHSLDRARTSIILEYFDGAR